MTPWQQTWGHWEVFKCEEREGGREEGRKEGRKEGSMGRKTLKPLRRFPHSKCYYSLSLCLLTSGLTLQAGFILMFDNLRNPVLQQRFYFSCYEKKKKSYLGPSAGYFLWWWKHEKLIHKPRDTTKIKNRNKGEKSIKTFQAAAIMPFQRNYRCRSALKWLINNFGLPRRRCHSVGNKN